LIDAVRQYAKHRQEKNKPVVNYAKN